jgi:SAM-dependent methyltransferase
MQWGSRGYPRAVPPRPRLRGMSVRALAFAGNAAHGLSQRLAAAGGSPTLAGDRWIEWSFCMARLAETPGRTLDFGADVGFLALAAAQRGHEVVALDRLAVVPAFHHERVEFLQADVLDRPLHGQTFDQILNCSSVEHVGLAGRYGSTDRADGDLEAMTIMREALKPEGRMVMTVPVGRDLVCAPVHRIYGIDRLPRLLAGYAVEEQQFWQKRPGRSIWEQTDRETALATQGSASYYALGLFVLTRS